MPATTIDDSGDDDDDEGEDDWQLTAAEENAKNIHIRWLAVGASQLHGPRLRHLN